MIDDPADSATVTSDMAFMSNAPDSHDRLNLDAQPLPSTAAVLNRFVQLTIMFFHREPPKGTRMGALWGLFYKFRGNFVIPVALLAYRFPNDAEVADMALEKLLAGVVLYIWMASYYDAARKRIMRSRCRSRDPARSTDADQ